VPVQAHFTLERAARCLATINVMSTSNSVVRRVSGRVTNYKDAEMALRASSKRRNRSENCAAMPT